MPDNLDTINFGADNATEEFDFEAEMAKTFAEDVAALDQQEEEVALVEDTREFASGFPQWDLGPNGIVDLD